MKKRLRLLSEVVLRTVKRRLASSFAIFFAFKNASMGLPSFHSGYPAFLQKKMAEEEGFDART